MARFFATRARTGPAETPTPGSFLVPGPDGPVGPAGDVARAATRAAMAAISASAGLTRYLTEARREGVFVFDASDLSALVAADTPQGVYIAPASAPTGASGAWVRKYEKDFDVRWFGAVADNATDASPAINAALLVLEAQGFAVDYGLATRGLHIPFGKYYCASSIIPQQTSLIYGDGNKGDAGGTVTELRFPAGVIGIDLVETLGIRAPSIAIFGLTLKGAYTNYASEGAFHGINAKVRFKAKDLIISGFQGNGFNIVATAAPGSGFLENANSFVIEDCTVEVCTHGIYVQGADVNAGRVVGLNASYNRRYGVYDISFLGNNYLACHSSGNGTSDFTGTVPPTIVVQAGNRYAVIPGQEAGASTNAPTGTATDNTWWRYLYPGAVSGTIFPAWFNGIVVRSGGSYFAGSSWFWGCYEEGDQGPCVVDSPGAVYDGIITNKGTGGFIHTYQGFTAINKLRVEKEAVFVNPQINYGEYTTDLLHQHNYLNGTTTRFYAAGGTFNGQVAYNNFEMNVATNTLIKFTIGPNPFALVDIAQINTDGINVVTGKAYYVNAQKVVGARGAALPADATDLATALTLLNAIKARLKVTGGHGLVAD